MRSPSAKPALEVDGVEGMMHLLCSGQDPRRPPNPTQKDLIYSDAEMLAYIGMLGNGKTTAICMLGWLLVLFEPGYRLMVGRKDYNDLKDTTAKRMEEMLHRLPAGTLIDRSKESPMKWWIQPVTYKGGLPSNLSDLKTDDRELAYHQATLDGLISEITFMGLHDRPSSYEFHGAIVDEADELEKEVFDEVDSRCRLPGRTNKIAIAFNPTDEDHWIFEDCTGTNAKGEPVLDVFGKPRGPRFKLLQPLRGENEHNLKAGYYEGRLKHMTPDMAERLILGKWGSSIKGTPVYGRHFRRDFHAKELLDYEPHQPVLRFHDFGFRYPVCIWAQTTAFGGLNILWEMRGENVEIHDWVPMIQAETRTRFPDAEAFIDWGDPAAKQRKDTGSTLHALANEGIKLKFIPNKPGIIDIGVRAGRLLLSRTIYGKPACKIDKRCTMLIRTLEKGYRYPGEGDRRSVERMDQPLKDGTFDHWADAWRYGIMGVFGQTGGQSYDAADPVDGAGVAVPASATLAGMYGLPKSMSYSASADPIKNRDIR